MLEQLTYLPHSYLLGIRHFFIFLKKKKKKKPRNFLVDYFLGALRFVCLTGKELNHVWRYFYS